MFRLSYSYKLPAIVSSKKTATTNAVYDIVIAME